MLFYSSSFIFSFYLWCLGWKQTKGLIKNQWEERDKEKICFVGGELMWSCLIVTQHECNGVGRVCGQRNLSIVLSSFFLLCPSALPQICTTLLTYSFTKSFLYAQGQSPFLYIYCWLYLVALWPPSLWHTMGALCAWEWGHTHTPSFNVLCEMIASSAVLSSYNLFSLNCVFLKRHGYFSL